VEQFAAETMNFSGLDNSQISLQYALVEFLPSEFCMNIAM